MFSEPSSGMPDRPQLWVIAGPNGAGKSTLVRQYLKGRMPYVNPDELVPHGRPGAAVAAGKAALAMRNDYLAQRASFAVETTLSGGLERKLMSRAIDAGYKVNLVYVGIASPQLSILRITVRVDLGGHHVPSGDVIQRHARSLEHLPEALSLAFRVFIFDNSDRIRRLIYSREDGWIKHLSKDLPSWARPVVEHEASRYPKRQGRA